MKVEEGNHTCNNNESPVSKIGPADQEQTGHISMQYPSSKGGISTDILCEENEIAGFTLDNGEIVTISKNCVLTGKISINAGSKLIINNATIKMTEYSSICVNNGSLEFTETKIITSNKISCNSDRICIFIDEATLPCKFNKCFFDGCNVYQMIRSIGNNIIITDSTFVNCFSLGNGGAVDIAHGMVSIANCKFINCRSNIDGGAIHINAKLYSMDNTFENCSSGNNGGAMWMLQGKLINTSFDNCCSGNSGGGVYLYYWNDIEVNKCKFNICSSSSGGGMYSVHKLSLQECSFTDCSRNGYSTEY